MISVSTAARRSSTTISPSIERITRASSANIRHLHHQRHHATNKHQFARSSLVASMSSGTSKPAAAAAAVTRNCLVRLPNVTGSRPLSSSAAPSSKPPTSGSSAGGAKKQKTGSSELLPNVALAAVLGGFVTSVFMYSMNAVGRGDGEAAEGNDPLAQLKAEAQEARGHRDRTEGGGRLSEDEIMALESGLGAAQTMTDGEADGDRIITDLAVAAPADIAALEEEANLKIFQQQQNAGEQPKEEKKKKKAWW
eukprot:CAMPEP_0197196020 /NCGR_PEP_ID=MMETSP1423-20130617/32132_1 /TAXON_ID=476441 /ORGANISM="Pseudo-nitzschia heimii, Strain UNC1101" /LENGTH=251 /DNA_ID=CAMNT_0042649785 /DNA_START=65 /DNA_END=817 /DNA_ORIENTATION=-